MAAHNGRKATVDTTAYALELGSTIASRSASGRSDDDRLGWLVPSAAAMSDGARNDLAADLAAGDFESAAERLVDGHGNFGPFHVIDSVERQLAGILPADAAGYPRDDLRGAYRFVINISAINAGS